ncbi:MAG: DUF4423 domain-containing protein [Myxococcales bacterium]|nr:DUF4423 domain-containing protein [Myxococcales bacterium]
MIVSGSTARAARSRHAPAAPFATRHSNLREGHDGIFAYNLCGVSERDLTRIRELHSAYYRELRAIVASSEPVDHVLLVNLQLVPLS